MNEDQKSLWLKWGIFILFAVLFLRLSIVPVDSYDYGFHLRTGEDIVKNLKFPLTETYSYTAAGSFNPAYSWIFDSVQYLFYSWFGISGFYFLQILLVLILFAILYQRVFKMKMEKDKYILFLLAINMMLAFAFFYAPRIMIRPHLMGNFLFLLFLLLYPRIFSFEYGGLDLKGMMKSPVTWLSIIIFVIWVNTHASFVEAFVILFAGMSAQLIKKASGKQEFQPLRNSIILTAVLSGLCFVNPNTYRVFGTFSTSTRYTEEFFSLFQILPKSGWQYIAIVAVYLTVFIIFAFRFIYKREFEKGLPLLIFIGLGIYSVRFLGDLGILSAFLLLPLVPEIAAFFGNRKGLKNGAAAVLTLLMAGQLFLLFFYLRPFGWGLDPKMFPAAAVKYLDRTDADGNLFNSYEWGSYLIWELPKHPVYIDGHIHIYPAGFIENYRNNLLQKPPFYFMSETKKWNIAFALVPYPTRIGNLTADSYSEYLFDRAGWALVYFDNLALIYMKRGFSAKNHALINNLEYKFLEPVVLAPPVLEKYLTNPDSAGKVVRELRRSVALCPDSIYSHFCLGYVLFKEGNLDEAIRELEITKSLYPHPQVLSILENLKSLRHETN